MQEAAKVNQKERRPKCKKGRVRPWRFLSLIACVFFEQEEAPCGSFSFIKSNVHSGLHSPGMKEHVI
jgi:hypothetical protein